MGKPILQKSSAKWLVFAALFIGVAVLRLFYCTQLPVNTGDLPRNIYYGLYANQDGLGAAGKSLQELNPSLGWIAWADMEYNYPIVALLFFMGIGKVSSTLFFAKLMLTLVEVFNSWLIFKYSKQRLLAFLYWASPISIWWVSHEGQFEPLQSFFLIAALCLLVRHRAWAFILLALAIQVKLTAVLLLPFFLFSIRKENPKTIIASMLLLIIGFIPSLVASFYYPMVKQVFATTSSIQYNPYYWNILKISIFKWNPRWLVFINQLVSYAILIFLIVLMIKWRDIKSFFAPISFISLCKVSTLGQFWYWVIYTPFLLPIQNKKLRLWLFALAPLFEVTSIISIVSGPFGYTLGTYYINMQVYTPLVIYL